MRSDQGILTICIHRFIQSQQVFHRHFCLYIVDWVKDKPAAWSEDLHALVHLLADLLGRTEGQGVLGIHAAAPEGDPAAKLVGQDLRVHAGCGGLHRVQDVETRIDEIREQVRERMEIFGRGGGFVFNPVHNVQAGVPVENLVALYEAVAEFRTYPLA